MKKVVVLLCLFLFKVSFTTEEEIQMEEFEVQLEQAEADETKVRLPPIFINITVANINDAHSSNRMNVLQNQTLIQESNDEKQTHKSSWDISHLALLALLAAAIPDNDSSNCWENGW